MGNNILRDIQCSNDVGRMAELGKFDKEFTVYGCAYRQGDETYYRVSDDPETIYQFWELNQREGIYPSAVQNHTQITAVPSGMEEDIWTEEKWQLGYLLMDSYQDEFLKQLNHLGNRPARNAANIYMNSWKNDLEGKFDREHLSLFEAFNNYFFLRKQLDNKSYSEFKNWLGSIWRQMEDDCILKDVFERTLYGFVWEKEGERHIEYDAQYVLVQRQWLNMVSRGVIVTPIFNKVYSFRAFTDFAKIKQEFQNLITQLFFPHMVFLEELNHKESFIKKDEFNNTYREKKEKFGEIAGQTLFLYGKLWNCI